ncbi:hypothetical protein ABIC20_005603 [Methylobacterium radiotolerans]|uniref:Uncharacterized protein n=1 Tax=Methylobacterium radiotolerans TaxID=31998 RepID=A0ABV2NP90_9HYPH
MPDTCGAPTKRPQSPGKGIPHGATRLIRSIDLKVGPEPSRAVLELVDGEQRAHRFFVTVSDLQELATISLVARRQGGFVAQFSPCEGESSIVYRGPQNQGRTDHPRAEPLDQFFKGGAIERRLFDVESSVRIQRRRVNALMATYVERARLPNGRVPASCCQRCGAPIGYLGRAFEAVGVAHHVCRAEREKA